MSIKLFDLTGKTALVTGGAQGLGKAIAVGLGKAGATLVINGRSMKRLQAAKEKYQKDGLDIHVYEFDVTQEKEVIAALDQIEKEVGKIDILVNNAAIIKRTPILEMEVEDFRKVLDVDLVAPFLMAKNVVKRMIANGKGGKVINMCSMMSEVSRNTVSAYAAAKGGLKMLTKEMADEWAKHGIQANAIGPGYFATDQTAPIRVGGHPFNDFIVKRTPARRWGNPDELQGAAIFLASKASDFVNGHVLYVDGGILATLGSHAGEE
ncbi:MAG TPA: gluconate 5-dehydrogenase [Bacteroidetes bacterium]|nr:gluconate 5-dehydrogenase [Bacteroidota bacterium]